MPRPPVLTPKTEISEAAATWLIRLQENRNNEQLRSALANWLNQDPSHRLEFEKFDRLWGSLEVLRTKRQSSKRKKQTLGATALGVILLAGIIGFNTSLTTTLETRTGEQQSQMLPDGTQLLLDGHTRIQLRLRPWSRVITLESGQIFLKVGKDLRPLVIRTGNYQIRDIGTAFSVSHTDQRISIEVQEGVVEARAVLTQAISIKAGQRLVSTGGRPPLVESIPESSVAQWASPRWEFTNLPLVDVVNQLNRLHEKPLRLSNENLGNLRLSGVFNRDDRQGMLQAISHLHHLRLTETNEATYLQKK